VNKDRRLGRGLAALLGTQADEELANSAIHAEPAAPLPQPALVASTVSPTITPNVGLFDLNVYEIDDNPFQPRREFSESEIASLSESLREHDMLQPVLVRQVGDRFQLISGERRLRAAIQAGWSTVPARVREADDRLVAELAIVENLQRKDLNPIEKALSFKRYLDEHHCTQEDLAQRLKIDRSTIANLMRLLELPSMVLDALRKGSITAGHARALLPLGDESEQAEFCQRIQSEGLSVRNTEQAVSDHIQNCEPDTIQFPTGDTRKKRTKSDQIASLEQEMRIALGTKVEIKQTARGRGRMIVHFKNAEEFERLRVGLIHREDGDCAVG
jgi:ParB family transcriptional regulator, chromosome partitioning protein